MTPLSAWRRLDRYLLRNHPEVWSLDLHTLQAVMLATMAVLTLLVWLLPLEQLLAHFYWVRFALMIAATLIALLAMTMSGISHAYHFTRGRWPSALRHWYFLIVLFSPVLVASLMAQARFQPLTHGYDLRALPNVQKSCREEANEACVEAVSRLSGLPREQIKQDAIKTARGLSYVVPDQLIRHWSEFLLFLLCLAYARQVIELKAMGILVDKNILVSSIPIMFSYPVILGTPLLYITDHSYVLPDTRSSWPILTGIAVLLSLILCHVTFYSHQRRGSALTWYWTAVLLGLPALVLLIPLLLSSPEQRLLHQALLLGGFLLLTPWLQRTHDRVRALPL